MWTCSARQILGLAVTLVSLISSSCYSADVVQTFTDLDVQRLNHLVVDKHTGRVFVAGVNKLYQLSPDLEILAKEITGPKNDSTECSLVECPPGAVIQLTDNVNKALIIDYATPQLISCGSLFQGTCTIRNIRNISDAQEVKEAVVANDATSSTVAFIAPGPPNAPVSQVMYVGVSYTANSPYRSEVPAVSSRSLDKERRFMVAESKVTTGTRQFVNSLARARFPINYVYGFSSDGFSYFLTTQPKNIASGSEFISKLVRVCHDDPNYYSYTEIPIDCTNEIRKYNLIQAAYVGKAGSNLSGQLGITTQDDVLFAVFSKGNATTNRPLPESALCVYSLEAIRRKFRDNILDCFTGNGQRGLDFISPSRACVKTPIRMIPEDFCGLDINTPFGGTEPIAALPVLSFNEHLTAVAETSVDDRTVVFVGTSDGHLKKIVVDTPTSAVQYGDSEVDPNSPVNPDMRFDPEVKHLYVMTKQKVSKIKLHECSVHKTCSDCLEANDPYCGWCSVQNKCNSKSDCQNAASDPLNWMSNEDKRCTIIASVMPNQLQRTRVTTLDLDIENLSTLSGEQFFCAFSALDKTLITKATRKSNGIKCPTPRTDDLPSIPQGQHHFTAKLSVRMADGFDLATTEFTFFECNSFSSCTQCVSSSFPCDWCLDGHRCTHDTTENCHNDILVTGVNRTGPSYRSGPKFCPALKTGATNQQQMLLPSGTRKAIRVEVQIIGAYIVVQTRFVCKFEIENRVMAVNAQLLGDRLYCDRTELSYTSSAPKIDVPFAIVWGGSRPLDNPDNLRLELYKCKYMADNCGMCLDLAEKYGCGWCQSTNTCEVRDQCDQESSAWLNSDQTCPNPEIHSVQPQLGPWEGGTDITIQGINLGKTVVDITASVAGLPCQIHPELYIRTKQIVCRVESPGNSMAREGPVIVRIEDFRGYSEEIFQFVDPIIESISPQSGPKNGVTVIRITGSHLNAGSNIQATIGDLPCSIISSQANETICLASVSNSTGNATLRMKFDHGTRKFDGFFEYVDDPTIGSVKSGDERGSSILNGIPAGGIKVSVTGRNFKTVQDPAMYVYYNDRVFVSRCGLLNDTNMICNSPSIEVTEDLDATHPPLLEYGFLMNEVTGVQNLSSRGYPSFVLHPDPVYEEFENRLKYYGGDYLVLDGQHLDLACQESDVKVQIGRSFCNVTSLCRRQLVCRPPSVQPQPLDSQGDSDLQKLPEVIVTVGDELKFNIGRLSYARIGVPTCSNVSHSTDDYTLIGNMSMQGTQSESHE